MGGGMADWRFLAARYSPIRSRRGSDRAEVEQAARTVAAGVSAVGVVGVFGAVALPVAVRDRTRPMARSEDAYMSGERAIPGRGGGGDRIPTLLLLLLLLVVVEAVVRDN
uniref:Uncharacterized protein n=1 Tax=Anopheles merus TaxID=30066 RepID=A0A182UZH5_ANOME